MMVWVEGEVGALSRLEVAIGGLSGRARGY